jgi:F-type H+-transporting ATPase subunit b
MALDPRLRGGDGNSRRLMPQLDVATFVPQLVWLAITFGILYLLMARVGLPRVGGAIEARRHRVDGDLARAAQLKAEAEAVMAAYQETLAKARAEAQAAVKETTDRMAAEAAERQRQLGEALARQTAEAERQIAAAKQRALSDMHEIAIDVARSVTEKVTGSAADPEHLAAAVDRALSERAA